MKERLIWASILALIGYVFTTSLPVAVICAIIGAILP
ncbi:hypothetical protein VPT02_043 [Vibrio phage VPT02]|nr:hypothetical protein VPT02_043 [Vibrio phage VPT02]QQO38400.1 hypothetical protein VPG01_042 [Vibrio phage VPG01]